MITIGCPYGCGVQIPFPVKTTTDADTAEMVVQVQVDTEAVEAAMDNHCLHWLDAQEER